MNEELKVKIAEWLGYKIHKYRKPVCEHIPRCTYWRYKGEDVLSNELPDFPNDIKACFEYIVPKLTGDGYSVSIHAGYFLGNFKCTIIKYDSDFIIEGTWYNEPALALCKAVEKLIDEQEANAERDRTAKFSTPGMELMPDYKE